METAPPKLAVLAVNVQLNRNKSSLKPWIAPPVPPDLPPVRVNPERPIGEEPAGSVEKIRLLLLPLIVPSAAPGPVMVTASEIAISPLDSVMSLAELKNAGSNVTVSAPG